MYITNECLNGHMVTQKTNGKVFESNIFRLIKFHFNQKLLQVVTEIWNCFKTLMYLQYNKQQTRIRFSRYFTLVNETTSMILLKASDPPQFMDSILCGGERIGKLSKQTTQEGVYIMVTYSNTLFVIKLLFVNKRVSIKGCFYGLMSYIFSKLPIYMINPLYIHLQYIQYFHHIFNKLTIYSINSLYIQ